MALYGPDSPPDEWWGTNDVRIEDDMIFDPVEVTFRSPFMSDAEASACPDCWVPFSNSSGSISFSTSTMLRV